MDKFRLRLNCLDHYQAIPSDFDPALPSHDSLVPLASRPRLPVIRVFGATESGQKACAHIHGAFPYLYVPYDGSRKREEGRHWPVGISESLLDMT